MICHEVDRRAIKFAAWHFYCRQSRQCGRSPALCSLLGGAAVFPLSEPCQWLGLEKKPPCQRDWCEPGAVTVML